MQIKIFLISCVIILILDGLYLTSLKSYLLNQIYQVQKSQLQINIIATLLCYLLLISGLNYFIIDKKKSIYEAFLLGIFVYGIYETTNWGIFKNWSFITVIIDTLWGGILFSLTTFLIYTFFKNKNFKNK